MTVIGSTFCIVVIGSVLLFLLVATIQDWLNDDD